MVPSLLGQAGQTLGGIKRTIINLVTFSIADFDFSFAVLLGEGDFAFVVIDLDGSFALGKRVGWWTFAFDRRGYGAGSKR